ncbi:MAG TPA: molybdopterin-dependent oxidoreductase [Oscillospiraceae bacterium]|nr:molybdopterin-dependent oxidoreductase [Oscillospiraceae bacterium]
MKKNLFLLSLVLLLLFTAACGSNQPAPGGGEDTPQGEEAIVIAGSELGEHKITVAELKELTPVEKEVVSVSSSGEENEYSVKGALFADVLAELGLQQKELSAIRFIAGDGYMMEVPQEVLAARDIILAYEIDGEPLQEKTKPLRAIVPEERSMYWVRNLVKIEILEAAVAEPLSKLMFLETVTSTMEQQDYTYYESTDQAVLCSELPLPDAGETVYLKASDGLDKNEKAAVFLEEGYIKVTGEAKPLYLSPNLPKGMHVKEILWLAKAEVGIFSVEQGLKYFTVTVKDGEEGIALTDILAEVQLAASEQYLLTAADGYEVEISKADLAQGLVYVRDSGEITVIFEGLPKNTTVKSLLAIEVK